MNKTQFIITLAIGLLGLNGCDFKTKPSTVTGNASYRVDSVEGKVFNENTLPGWNIPQDRRFNIAACIKPISGQTEIVGHEFEVFSGDELKGRGATDSRGCLWWQEVVRFDFLAPPTYVKQVRTLKSLGKQRGTVDFEFAINPWSGELGSEPAVVDLKRVSVPRIVDVSLAPQALKAKEAQAVGMEIDSIDYNLLINNPTEDQQATLRIIFKPSLVLTDMSGQRKLAPLSKGSFMVTPFIYRLDDNKGDSRTLIHVPFPAQRITFDSGVPARFDEPIKFNGEELDRQKKYALVLLVVPTDGPAYIAPFKRVFDIPSYAKLAGGTLNQTAESLRVGNPLAEAYIKSIDPLKVASKNGGAALFFADRIKGGEDGVNVSADSMMVRRVGTLMETAIQWSFNSEPVAGREFLVYSMQPDENGKHRSQKVKTNSSGLLVWADDFEHGLYEVQERQRVEIVIEDVLTKQKITKCAHINPWDPYNTHFRDCRDFGNGPPPRLATVDSSINRKPTLLVNSLCVSRTDSDTGSEREGEGEMNFMDLIQPDLSMKVKHRYALLMNAYIKRNDSIAYGMSAPQEELRGGWWLVTIAMFRNSPDEKGPLKPVYTYEKAVCNPGLSLSAEITVALKNISLMDRLNYFAVQIKPLDQKKLKFVSESTDVDSGYCAGKAIAPDSPLEIHPKNDLVSRPFIFQMNLKSAGSCPNVIKDSNNFEQPRLVKLGNELNKKGLRQLHFDMEAKRKAEEADILAKLQEEREKGPENFARRMNSEQMKPEERMEITVVPGDSREVFKFLSCLNQNFWAPEGHHARCLDEMGGKGGNDKNSALFATARFYCLRAANHAGDEETRAKCLTDPLSQILVEEKIHVLKLKDAKYLGGFSSTLGLTTSFGFGNFNGSDFGNLLQDGLAVSANAMAVAGLGKNWAAERISKLVKAKPENPVKGSLEGIDGLDLTAVRSWGAFNINFTREFMQNVVDVSNSTNLVLENADVELTVGEYRRCFLLSTRNMRKRALYYCGPIEDRPFKRRERYYGMFSPYYTGMMTNGNDDKNRFLFQWRGERTYYHLMSRMVKSLAPFHHDGVSIPIAEIMERLPYRQDYVKYADRFGWGEPYILSTAAPDREVFVRTPGSLREINWFNPFKHFKNKPYRELNDPKINDEDRVWVPNF